MQIYMDDIIIYAETVGECIQKLKRVLAVAERFCLVIKWKKCRFLNSKMDCLGHTVENALIIIPGVSAIFPQICQRIRPHSSSANYVIEERCCQSRASVQHYFRGSKKSSIQYLTGVRKLLPLIPSVTVILWKSRLLTWPLRNLDTTCWAFNSL